MSDPLRAEPFSIGRSFRLVPIVPRRLVIVSERRLASGTERAVAAAVTGCFVLFATVIAADTLWTVFRLHSPLPYFDEWASLALYRSIVTGDASIGALFSQHNEHRIFFPRLVLYSDYLFFRGRGYFDFAAIVAIQATEVLLLVNMLRAAGTGALARIALTAVAVALLFSLRQEENFSWGFQVQFVGVFAAATASFACFARGLERARAGEPAALAFAAAFGAALVSTFCMANGLLTAIVLIVLAVVAREGRRVVLAAAVVAAILSGLYFHGYVPETESTPIAVALRQPGNMLRYASVYLGGMLDPDLAMASLLGAWAIFGAGAMTWRVVSGCDRDHAERFALFGVVLFALGTASLSAIGRVSFGLDQALASRYATGSGTFWAATTIYWWCVARGTSGRGADLIRAAVACTAAVLLWGAWRAQFDDKPGMEERALAQAEASDALLLGFDDPQAFAGVHTMPDEVGELAPFLRDHGLSIFAERDARLIGRPLRVAGTTVGPDACAGHFNIAAAAPAIGHDGVRVAGSAWDRWHDRPIRTVVLADAAGTVVGLAAAGGASQSNKSSTPWRGYARAAVGAELHAFAVLRERRLCELGSLTVAAP